MRKTLSHNLLLTELYNQLKFPVKPPGAASLYRKIYLVPEIHFVFRSQEENRVTDRPGLCGEGQGQFKSIQLCGLG